MGRVILALDQGTTSSRAIVFDTDGTPLAIAQKEFAQHFPQPGWVEHDAEEIWTTQLAVARSAMRKARVSAADILAIGITNQRETTVMWDRRTGRPVYHAIVWQDRRTAGHCERLRRGTHRRIGSIRQFQQPRARCIRRLVLLVSVGDVGRLVGAGDRAGSSRQQFRIRRPGGRRAGRDEQAREPSD